MESVKDRYVTNQRLRASAHPHTIKVRTFFFVVNLLVVEVPVERAMDRECPAGIRLPFDPDYWPLGIGSVRHRLHSAVRVSTSRLL